MNECFFHYDHSLIVRSLTSSPKALSKLLSEGFSLLKTPPISSLSLVPFSSFLKTVLPLSASLKETFLSAKLKETKSLCDKILLGVTSRLLKLLLLCSSFETKIGPSQEEREEIAEGVAELISLLDDDPVPSAAVAKFFVNLLKEAMIYKPELQLCDVLKNQEVFRSSVVKKGIYRSLHKVCNIFHQPLTL